MIVPLNSSLEDQSVSDLAASSLEIDARLRQNVDWLLRLKTVQARTSYDSFHLQSQTLSSILMLNLFLAVLAVPFLAVCFIHLNNIHHTSDYIYWISTTLLVFVINIAVWSIYFYHKKLIAQNKGILPDSSKLFLQRFQKVTFMIMEIAISYRYLYKITHHNDCIQHDGALQLWDCDSYLATKPIPHQEAILLMLLPILYSVSMRGGDLKYVMVIYAFSLSILIFSLIYLRAVNSILFVLYYILSSVVILVELKRQSYFLFFTQEKLEEINKERKKAFDEANATEMRHMIANVAHDLKTVTITIL
jgi:hypothetical protein